MTTSRQCRRGWYSPKGCSPSPLRLAAHWGLLILALVPVAYVWKRTQAATVETEDGAQATYASYGYIEVKLIR